MGGAVVAEASCVGRPGRALPSGIFDFFKSSRFEFCAASNSRGGAVGARSIAILWLCAYTWLFGSSSVAKRYCAIASSRRPHASRTCASEQCAIAFFGSMAKALFNSSAERLAWPLNKYQSANISRAAGGSDFDLKAVPKSCGILPDRPVPNYWRRRRTQRRRVYGQNLVPAFPSD